MKFNKFVIVLIIIGMLFQTVLPGLLFATTRARALPFHELIEWSELILVVQPTEIENKPSGGWAKFQVLEVWKGSLKKKNFTMGWGHYNLFGTEEHIYGKARHLMFLRRGPRKTFFGAFQDWSFWPLQKIQFPGLEDKREAVVYQDPVNRLIFPQTAQWLLRDTTTKQMENGERVYRKAILMDELRIYVKEILASEKKQK